MRMLLVAGAPALHERGGIEVVSWVLTLQLQRMSIQRVVANRTWVLTRVR